MQARAIFRRKEVCFEPNECEIEKVIHLSDSDFARFQQTLLDNYDFLHENADLMRVENRYSPGGDSGASLMRLQHARLSRLPDIIKTAIQQLSLSFGHLTCIALAGMEFLVLNNQ